MKEEKIYTDYDQGYEIVKNSQGRWVILHWRKLGNGDINYHVRYDSGTGLYGGWNRSAVIEQAISYASKYYAAKVAEEI